LPFQRVAEQRPRYETLLKALQERKSDENLFLEGGDFNEAAAEMSERLGTMVSTQAEDNCQIVSRQPVRPRVQERYQKVTVNVRMRCEIEDLQKILYSLETGVPMVIADEVTIIKPRARRRSRRAEPAPQTVLDIRFNMFGYLPVGGS
jgi:general secretion pathway protein M